MSECTIRVSDTMPVCWNDYLLLLYRPLTGKRPVLLYGILQAAARFRAPVSIEELMEMAGLNEGQWKEDRQTLERYELLSTWQNQDGSEWRIELLSPLDPRTFLRHEVFGRLFFEAKGSRGVEMITRLYDIEPPQREDPFQEVSDRRLDLEILDNAWSEDKEEILQRNIPLSAQRELVHFDWKKFANNGSVFPDRMLTPEAKARIGRLANMYGLDEVKMRQICNRFTDLEKTRFNFEGIASELARVNKRSIVKVRPDDYSASPVAFLKSRQPANADILPAERRLLDYLQEHYGFNNEVINTLVEFSMNSCQGAFIGKYIESVANNWARNGIDTRQKALDYLEKSRPSSNGRTAKNKAGSLPDWYAEKPATKASSEEIEQARALVRSLREGRNNPGSQDSRGN